MLNRLWAWVKSMFDRLLRRKRQIVNGIDYGLPPVYPSTNRGGPNMPKRQPCPLCRRMAKRVRKTVGGGHYYCRRCKSGAFVRAR